jgi:hypothetical protein
MILKRMFMPDVDPARGPMAGAVVRRSGEADRADGAASQVRTHKAGGAEAY